MRCAKWDCNEQGRVYYKGLWFCKPHSEDYANIDEYVDKFYKNKNKMDKNKQRRVVACPKCGYNKKTTTHTFGTYRVYQVQSTIILICKTCRHEKKYKILMGAKPRKED